MFFNKSLLAAISAAMFVGSATAFTGSASIGFVGTTNWQRMVPLPSPSPAQTSTTARASLRYSMGSFDAGAGTDNIHLSQVAFAQIEDNSSETPVSPVTWAFN
ncbi:hypothetical protein DFH08DRAFT_979592 [Mycena albidolilacea]|uniref:PEP-CTERM sorting domain-containing protein n=1 Tax=Mycena albidolilacea TaxID=1033008 RepID=A0AAD7E782_9AGAR|nr:hypothetical protein DFH08DRAFT_979592 [Mycena albidolilacea]